MWRDDDDLFALMRAKLFPAVVGDILDTMGCLHQFLAPQIRPLRPDMVVIGRAMPVLEANCFAASEPEGRASCRANPSACCSRHSTTCSATRSTWPPAAHRSSRCGAA